MELQKLVRNNIRELKPYSSAREKYQDGIFMDANENSFGSVVEMNDINLNRYPDPHQNLLRNALSEYLDVTPGKLFFGVGSDEIIDLIIRIFCDPGLSNVIIPGPTYGMYKVACDINNVLVRACSLDNNFDVDIESILKTADDNTKIIFLCSPNNPTGNILNKEAIRSLAAVFNGIIFIDEAYIDFVEDKSFLKDLFNYKNVIISRTFSKAWGLAGVRCGYCIADEYIISTLFKVKAPYNISTLTSNIILKSFKNLHLRKSMISDINNEKERLIYQLNTISLIDHMYPSSANFILVKLKEAGYIFKCLNEKKIRVRRWKDEERLRDCIRITIGTKEENNILINVLKQYNKRRTDEY
jgi:histidinol-phosphate aminotransferase